MDRRFRARVATFCLFGLQAMAAAAQTEFLHPNEAFAVSARALDPGMLEVRFDIARGYYMYRDKFAFKSLTPGVAVGAPQLPRGTVIQDEYFGKVETFRGPLHVRVPYSGKSPRVALEIKSQGCAEAGLCYPVQTQRLDVSLGER